MDFHNFTPFPALAYSVVDLHGDKSHVIVARGTYELGPAGDEGAGVTHQAALATEQAQIAFKDAYFGEMNRSSVKHEGDLAPGKPRCDVIVIGSAHSPSAEPVARVEVGVRIHRSAGIAPLADAGTKLEHRLVVHGPRAFVRRDGAWRLTDPEAFTSQRLRYEHAFGGDLRVYAHDEAAARLGDEHRLSAEARGKHPEGEGAPVAHTTCFHNPLGQGWIEGWYADAASIERWPAPQIEAPGAQMTASSFERLLRGEVHEGELPELTPRGLGVVAKPWQPRLARAGTLDARWLAERWPNMPLDYDLSYWNGAHTDMQCDYLWGGEVVELWNLLPTGAAGVRAEEGRTVCRFALPEAPLVAEIDCAEGQGHCAPHLDTVIVDLDTEPPRLSLVWRLVAPAALQIEQVTMMSVSGFAASVEEP